MKKYAMTFALLLCGAQPAYAQDAVVGQPERSSPVVEERPTWALQVTPYLWAPGLKGNISPFRHAPTIGVRKSFSDVMDDFNVGGFINVWGRRDRFVFSVDAMYISTTDGRGTGSLQAFQIPGLGVAIPPGASVDAKVDSKQFTATVLGGYRFLDTPQFTLDGLAGARFWHISNDVAVTASHAAIGTRSASHGEDFSWLDPVVGVRAFLPVTEKLSLQGQADVGGFGAGSNHTWSGLVTVNYVFSGPLSASAGYKVLDVDYDHGGHVYDTRLSGPVLGLTYRF
ncbi:hypothetical protein RN629_16375 [Sphingomonadaceae bacterium jetA1]|uniref:hypothetical protein n=1 Tax=Facivitalis istanbulensis TaxID=3075838 RepID=UPI00346A3BE8